MDAISSFISIARSTGKGNNQEASATVLPAVHQLEQAASGEKPALFLLATLVSEKPVGADKILSLALETVADRFYEGYRTKPLRLMQEIAEESQDILADLFFKAGFSNESFRVSLDIAMVAILKEVFYVWIDGEISVHFVREGKSVALRESFGEEGEERFSGSGRIDTGDKIAVFTDVTRKKEWIIDQLKGSLTDGEVILSNAGKFSGKEVALILGFGKKSQSGEADMLAAPEQNKLSLHPRSLEDCPEATAGDSAGSRGGGGEPDEEFEKAQAADSGSGVEKSDSKAQFELEDSLGGDAELEKNKGDSSERTGERAGGSSKFSLSDVRKWAVSVWSCGLCVKLRSVFKDWVKAIGYTLSSLASKIFGGRGRRVAQSATRHDKGRLIKGFLGLIIVVFLCGGIGYLANSTFRDNRSQQQYEEMYADLVSSVSALETSALDLTISDLQKLGTAESLSNDLEDLKANKFADLNSLDELSDRIQTVKDTVTGTTPITSINVVSDVALSFNNVQVIDFAVKGDAAYLLDSSGGRVFVVDLLTRSASIYVSSEDLKSGIAIAWTRTPSASKDRLFVYTEQGGVFEVKKTGETAHVAGLSAIGSEVVEVATFQDNLYFLSTSERVVYRSTASGTSYSIPRAYNSAPLLANAVDMAIDGAIWIIGDDGGIQRLFREGTGVKISDVAVVGISDPLGSGCRLATPLLSQSSQKQNLYILDPDNKRIVVVDKSPDDGRNYLGQLEYRGDSGWFNDLKEIELSSDGRVLYVLDGSTLVEVEP